MRCSSTRPSRAAASTRARSRSCCPSPRRPGIAAHLIALVHKQLIRAERSELPGQDAFRFAHALIREAAYRGLPKQRRAELHERMAGWLDAQAGPQDETVGFHLGEAYDLRAELGQPEPAPGRRRRRSGSWSPPTPRSLRGDPPAGVRLLERAESLLRADGPAHGELLPRLGAALFEAGRLDDAARVLDQAIAQAPEPRLRARAQVEREFVRLESETSVPAGHALAVIESVRPLLEAERDERRAVPRRGCCTGCSR